MLASLNEVRACRTFFAEHNPCCLLGNGTWGDVIPEIVWVVAGGDEFVQKPSYGAIDIFKAIGIHGYELNFDTIVVPADFVDYEVPVVIEEGFLEGRCCWAVGKQDDLLE